MSSIGLRLQDFTPQKMLKCNVELSKRGIAHGQAPELY